MWFICFRGIEDSPAQAGFDELDTGDESPKKRRPSRRSASCFCKIFARREPWIIAFASMCIGMVRHSIDHFYAGYFSRVFHIANKGLTSFGPYRFASLVIPAAAVLGGLMAGHASDRLFGARRARVIVLASLAWRSAWCRCGSLSQRLDGGGPAGVARSVHPERALAGRRRLLDGLRRAEGGRDGSRALRRCAVPGRSRGEQRCGSAAFCTTKTPTATSTDWWPLAPLPFALIGILLMSSLWHVLPGRKPTSASWLASESSGWRDVGSGAGLAPSLVAGSTVPAVITGQPAE